MLISRVHVFLEFCQVRLPRSAVQVHWACHPLPSRRREGLQEAATSATGSRNRPATSCQFLCQSETRSSTSIPPITPECVISEFRSWRLSEPARQLRLMKLVTYTQFCLSVLPELCSWTENGLVNGALGTVCDIRWSAGSDWRRDPPFAILVLSTNTAVQPYIQTDMAVARLFPCSGLLGNLCEARYSTASPDTVPIDSGVCDNCA
jgi:hypothetical protein